MNVKMNGGGALGLGVWWHLNQTAHVKAFLPNACARRALSASNEVYFHPGLKKTAQPLKGCNERDSPHTYVFE